MWTTAAHLMIPLPGSQVDGLPHSAQHGQAAAVMLAHVLDIGSLKGADEGGGSVKYPHLQGNSSMGPQQSGTRREQAAESSHYAATTHRCAGGCPVLPHLVLCHYLPTPARVRVVGYTLVHNIGGSVKQGPISQVGVPCDLQGQCVNIESGKLSSLSGMRQVAGKA